MRQRILRSLGEIWTCRSWPKHKVRISPKRYRCETRLLPSRKAAAPADSCHRATVPQLGKVVSDGRRTSGQNPGRMSSEARPAEATTSTEKRAIEKAETGGNLTIYAPIAPHDASEGTATEIAMSPLTWEPPYGSNVGPSPLPVSLCSLQLQVDG